MNMMSKRTMSIFGILICSVIGFLYRAIQRLLQLGFYFSWQLVLISDILFFIFILLLIATAVIEILIIYGKIKNYNLLRTIEYMYLAALCALEVAGIISIFGYDLATGIVTSISSLLDFAFYVIIFMDVFGISSKARELFDKFWFIPSLVLVGVNVLLCIAFFILGRVNAIIYDNFRISDFIFSCITLVLNIIGSLIVPCYILRIKFGHDEHYYPDNYRS